MPKAQWTIGLYIKVVVILNLLVTLILIMLGVKILGDLLKAIFS